MKNYLLVTLFLMTSFVGMNRASAQDFDPLFNPRTTFLCSGLKAYDSRIEPKKQYSEKTILQTYNVTLTFHLNLFNYKSVVVKMLDATNKLVVDDSTTKLREYDHDLKIRISSMTEHTAFAFIKNRTNGKYFLDLQDQSHNDYDILSKSSVECIKQ